MKTPDQAGVLKLPEHRKKRLSPYKELLFHKDQISDENPCFDIVTIILECHLHIALGLESSVNRCPGKLVESVIAGRSGIKTKSSEASR